MTKQLTVRGVSDEVAARLESISKARGRSVNSTVLEILQEAVGIQERRARLQRMATWSDEDLAEFEEALEAQRVIDEELCLGCGVCTRNCRLKALTMQPREKRVITPVNSTHKVVLMAIERGKLQNLIFDNQVLWSHRALAAMLGVILKLPPVKRALASEQVGSRYLGRLCEWYDS